MFWKADSLEIMAKRFRFLPFTYSLLMFEPYALTSCVEFEISYAELIADMLKLCYSFICFSCVLNFCLCSARHEIFFGVFCV